MTPLIGDEPSPYASLATWEQFLKEMRAEPETILKSRIVQAAKRMIEIKEAGGGNGLTAPRSQCRHGGLNPFDNTTGDTLRTQVLGRLTRTVGSSRRDNGTYT